MRKLMGMELVSAGIMVGSGGYSGDRQILNSMAVLGCYFACSHINVDGRLRARKDRRAGARGCDTAGMLANIYLPYDQRPCKVVRGS